MWEFADGLDFNARAPCSSVVWRSRATLHASCFHWRCYQHIAKGRVERANRTLQDRLIKELRLAGISDMEADNAFLPEFMLRYNAKFAKHPTRSNNMHKPLNIMDYILHYILCKRE